jgi:hypothetical protein
LSQQQILLLLQLVQSILQLVLGEVRVNIQVLNSLELGVKKGHSFFFLIPKSAERTQGNLHSLDLQLNLSNISHGNRNVETIEQTAAQ